MEHIASIGKEVSISMDKYVVNNDFKNMTSGVLKSQNINKGYLNNISIYEFNYFYEHVINHLAEEDKKVLDAIKQEKQKEVDDFYKNYNQGSLVPYLNGMSSDKLEHLKNILGFGYTEEDLRDKSLLWKRSYEELVEKII